MESGFAIRKNAGSGSVSGSALNQCGSETLDGRHSTVVNTLTTAGTPEIGGTSATAEMPEITGTPATSAAQYKK